MELNQHHVIKFRHLKGLKLDDIATEPLSRYGQDTCTKPSIKDSLHGETPPKFGRSQSDCMSVQMFWNS
jgi:hypothetical protein